MKQPHPSVAIELRDGAECSDKTEHAERDGEQTHEFGPEGTAVPGTRRRRWLAAIAVLAVFVTLVKVLWVATPGSLHPDAARSSVALLHKSGADCAAALSSTSNNSNPTAPAAASASPTATSTAPAVAASNLKRRPVIVVFGDSTTQYGGEADGWEALLHEAYVRSADTINRGLSGYNTRLFLQYAMPGISEEMVHYYAPTVVVIWFGVNDGSVIGGTSGPQHIPLDEYKGNLQKIIAQLRAVAPQAHVLLLSPGYVDEKQRLAAMLGRGRAASDPLDRTNEEVAKYAAACSEVAAQLSGDDHVGYLDVYDYFTTNYPMDEQRAELLRDGLHFSARGNRVFYELVKAKIETMVAPSLLRTHQFPDDVQIIQY